jgi:hypothetical protein
MNELNPITRKCYMRQIMFKLSSPLQPKKLPPAGRHNRPPVPPKKWSGARATSPKKKTSTIQHARAPAAATQTNHSSVQPMPPS